MTSVALLVSCLKNLRLARSGLRVSEEEELRALELRLHGEEGYKSWNRSHTVARSNPGLLAVMAAGKLLCERLKSS